MILRRVITHFRKQEWTAIALDFLIVIIGVFIGIQVSNWNAQSGDNRNFAEARVRLIDETAQNIKKVKTLQSELEATLPVVSAGIDALLACDATPEGIDLVNAALKAAIITFGLYIDRNALDAMLGSETHLARLDNDERQRLEAYATLLETMQLEIRFFEMKPMEDLYWTSPSVGFEPLQLSTIDYQGVNLNVLLRPPVLATDMTTACQDNELIKRLRVWEHFQLIIPADSEIIEAAMRENLVRLGELVP